MTPTYQNRRRIMQAITAALLGTLSAAPSWAHDDAYLDTVKAPHGGQLRMAGPVHLELVLDKAPREATEKRIDVYVTDHAGKPQATAGASGTITILYGKTKVSAALQPAGDNRLNAQALYAATPDLKAIVSLTMAGQAVQQARFTPLTSLDAAHDAHH